jgi:sugar diacid utilization regulator
LPEGAKLNLLCTEDTDIPAAFTKNKYLNLILADAEIDISQIFNDIQDIFMDSYFIMQSSAALFNTIIRGKGLQYIMEIGSGLLGNPIMMGDSNHRLLAYSKDDNIDDPAWIEFRDKGYCTYEYTKKYGFQRWIDEQVQSKTPIIGDLGAISKKRRIFSKIVIDDTIVGHFAVLENNKPFSQRDIEITSFICDVISAEMKKNSHFRNTRSVMLENLIIDLLDGKKLSEEEVREKIKYLNWKPKEKLYILSIKYNSYENTFSLISFIRDSLGEMMEGEMAFFYDNHIIFILGCSKDSSLKNDDFMIPIRFLKENRLYAGLSHGFGRITDLQKCYKQSLSSIMLGQRIDKNKVLYMYEDYIVYHMIDICNKQGGITDFCHPAISKLRTYDINHKSDYVRSLYSYIANARNLISTADALFIHRNTMSYRLAKIQEITGVELDDDDVIMNLFVSYKILEYAGKL